MFRLRSPIDRASCGSAAGRLLRGVATRLARVGLLAALIGLLAGPAGAQAAEPGVVLGGNFFSSAPTFTTVSGLGVGWVRAFLYWPTLEPARGQLDLYTLGAYDRAIASLPPGTKVDLVVVGSPRWETGSANVLTPPANPADYADFMHMLASHFAGRVAGWEIWNEPDAPEFWVGAPDAPAYARLLQATYPAIKAADPRATVVLGGLTGNNYHFLEQVYAAGAKGSFDAVGVHTDTACNLNSPYLYLRDGNGRINQFSFLGYREVRKTMLANGDDKPIWMTELGWSVTRQRCAMGRFAGQKAGGVAAADQATYMRQAYHCLAGDPYMQVAIWFELQDAGGADASQNRFGLLDGAMKGRPALRTLSDIAHHGDKLAGGCGNFTGPRIAFRRPRMKQSYRGPLPITVSASSPAGVPSITLLYDGKLIRHFTNENAPRRLFGVMRWFGAWKLSAGQHTITAVAFDPQHNTTSNSVTIVHLHEGHR